MNKISYGCQINFYIHTLLKHLYTVCTRTIRLHPLSTALARYTRHIVIYAAYVCTSSEHTPHADQQHSQDDSSCVAQLHSVAVRADSPDEHLTV